MRWLNSSTSRRFRSLSTSSCFSLAAAASCSCSASLSFACKPRKNGTRETQDNNALLTPEYAVHQWKTVCWWPIASRSKFWQDMNRQTSRILHNFRPCLLIIDQQNNRQKLSDVPEKDHQKIHQSYITELVLWWVIITAISNTESQIVYCI